MPIMAAMSDQKPTLSLTLKEAAQELRCSTEKLRRLVHSGEIEGFKVGRVMRIKRRSLEEYIESNAV